MLRDLVFFFSSRAVLLYSAPAVTERSRRLLNTLKLSYHNQGEISLLIVTSPEVELWDICGRIDVTCRSSRKDVTVNTVDCY